MNWTESGFIVATLLIALIALLLVVAARRDARMIREQAESDAKRSRAEIARARDTVERQQLTIDNREDELEDRIAVISQREAELAAGQASISRIRREYDSRLEVVAGLTEDEARAQLHERVEREEASYIERTTRDRLIKAEKSAHSTAQRILVDSLARLAVPTSSELAVEVFELESEDLKGRIIGKEGRNIKTFEAVTGVDLLIEDHSLSVKVSSFDSERRDVAITALANLLKGGVVSPARIETEVEKARETIAQRSKEAGFSALEQVGVKGVAPELVRLLGRLRFRKSYTQNVLEHSIETSLIAGILADEVGLDSEVARRAGLLHDIGKVMTPAQRGSHAAIGAQLARTHGESSQVVNAIAAHHNDVEASSLEAIVVQIADSISASRPGARKEDVGSYFTRMEAIEAEVLSFEGVQSAFVLSAGHQIRVAVAPNKVPENELTRFTERLGSHLQSVVPIPGEIEITVIRENRTRITVG